MSKIVNLVQKAGEGTTFLFDKSIEGFSDMFKGSIELVNNLAFDGSENTFKVFSFLFMHRVSVAEIFYPTDELAKYVLANPDDLIKKYDLYKQFKRKKKFYYKLSMGLSILPHQKHITDKILTKNENDQKVNQAIELFELQKIKKSLFEKLNDISDEDLCNSLEEIRTLIEIKIELSEHSGIEELLFLCKSIKYSGYSMAMAQFKFSNKEYHEAIDFYIDAISYNIPYAKDELAELIDEIDSKSIPIDTIELKDKYLDGILSETSWNKIKGLPLAFIAMKTKELQNIKNSLQGENNG